jgi:RNA polymerase sigma-70 factor (ECF subfamily)
MAGWPGSGSAGAGTVGDVLGEVYSAHYDRLMGFFVRRTRDRGLAEDLTHDVLLRFVESGLHDGSRPVWPYLRAVAANVLVDHVRRSSREVLGGSADWDGGPADTTGVEDDLVLRGFVGSVIGGLPERQQVAVELRYGRAWSVGEAADLLGISVGTCRQLLFRARQNLKAALEQSGSRVHGVVAPALLAVRMRWRNGSTRLRDLTQAPVMTAGVDAMASVMIATGLAIAAATGGSSPASLDSAPVLEFAAASVVPDDDVWVAAMTAVPPPESADEVGVTSSAAPGVDNDGRSAERRTTEIVTPQARVTSVETEGEMIVEEDEEYFSVRHDISVRVGDHDHVYSSGDTVGIPCTGLVGEVVCSVDDDFAP